MTQELKQYKDLVNGLLGKLDEERQKSSRLESELSYYKEPARDSQSFESRLAEKDGIISHQKQVIDKQNQEIEWLRRKLWGKSSEKRMDVDPDQLCIDFGDLSISPEEEASYKAAQDEAKAYHERRKAEGEVRKSKNKPSRRPIPENLKRLTFHIYPEGYNEAEWDLLPEGFDEKKEVLHRSPAEYFVAEYILHKAVKKEDVERTIQNSPAPQTPIAKSYAGSTLLANLMIGKYVDHQPFYRQVEMMKRQGMNIPPTTISDWFKDVADLLRPLYFRIRDMVLGSDYIQADETTVPITDDEKHRTVKGYLWQVRAVMLNLLFFHYDKGSRSKDVATGLFAHFRGALQSDGYPVYDYYETKQGVLCLICWAHARRYFCRALNNDEARAKIALEQIGLLYEIEREADDKQMSYNERRDLRMRLSVPILHGFEVWLQNEYPKVLPKSPIGKAIHFALERYERLCRYVTDGRYKIDSNLVENGQRPVALGRKNYLFCKNHDAAEDAAVIYTMMGCCKAADVNPERWLTYFLDHVHDYDEDYSRDLAELLPSNLKAKGLLGVPEILQKFSESL